MIDGVNVKEYNLEALNRKIGYVPQRGVLFSGTVRGNVNFGDNNSDEDTICFQKLVVRAHAHHVAIVQNNNFVRILDGANALCNNKLCHAGCVLLKRR